MASPVSYFSNRSFPVTWSTIPIGPAMASTVCVPGATSVLRHVMVLVRRLCTHARTRCIHSPARIGNDGHRQSQCLRLRLELTCTMGKRSYIHQYSTHARTRTHPTARGRGRARQSSSDRCPPTAAARAHGASLASCTLPPLHTAKSECALRENIAMEKAAVSSELALIIMYALVLVLRANQIANQRENQSGVLRMRYQRGCTGQRFCRRPC